MESIIPEIKKDIKSFFLEERGDISKQVLISFGALVAGMGALSLLSKAVGARTISIKHDHCDPGHGSAHGNSSPISTHSSANGVPSSHCSSHGSYASAGWAGAHASVNAAHTSNAYITYG
jgi:hypothetical protein